MFSKYHCHKSKQKIYFKTILQTSLFCVTSELFPAVQVSLLSVDILHAVSIILFHPQKKIRISREFIQKKPKLRFHNKQPQLAKVNFVFIQTVKLKCHEMAKLNTHTNQMRF